MHTHACARTPRLEPLSQAGVSSEKVLLDGEAIQRSLTRIAHEIVEAQHRPRATSRSSASTRAASRSPSACGT